jgi:hypothetical protein
MWSITAPCSISPRCFIPWDNAFVVHLAFQDVQGVNQGGQDKDKDGDE